MHSSIPTRIPRIANTLQTASRAYRTTCRSMAHNRNNRMDRGRRTTVKPVKVFQHNASGYSNHHCRCIDCTNGWAKQQSKLNSHKRAERYEVDGRMVHPTCKHGAESSYTNYSCRCLECTEAHRVARTERRKRGKIEKEQ